MKKKIIIKEETLLIPQKRTPLRKIGREKYDIISNIWQYVSYCFILSYHSIFYHKKLFCIDLEVI